MPEPIDDKSAKRRADHRNRNARKRAPLFAAAGIVPIVTPEEVKVDVERRDKASAEHAAAWHEQVMAKVEMYRGICMEYLHEDIFDPIDQRYREWICGEAPTSHWHDRRSTGGASHEYHADYWWQVLAKYDLGPAVEHRKFFEGINAEVARIGNARRAKEQEGRDAQQALPLPGGTL